MEAKLLHFMASKPLAPPSLVLSKFTLSYIVQPTRSRRLSVTPILTRSDGSGSSSTSSADTDDSNNSAPTQTDVVGVRFKKRSKKKAKQQREREGDGERIRKAEAAVPKKWEEMSIGEKALELYLGEKGALYWINKSAYASIYIVIGAWILFRFVGPALNLYQLDSAPLSPAAILKGS